MQTQKETLERKLYLQRLQINRLLDITQAINNNISSKDLFQVYKSALTWELRIEKFVLYTRKDDAWVVAASAGVDEVLLALDIEEYFEKYERIARVEEPEHPLLGEFDIVIPAYHKKYPIAFTFIDQTPLKSSATDTDEDADNEAYETIKFISAITNVISVAIENKRLFKRQLEQERQKREIELAVQVQNMLIPSNLPKNDLYEYSGIYQPHKGVGGDYYDFMELGDREIAFCIADISGKGVAAALLMSNFQANLQSLIHRKYLSVSKFANRLNSLVLRTTKGEKFITFFIARYHIYKKRLRYLCAGHNPPFMYTEGKLQRMDKGCTILGAFDKLPEIEFGEVYLKDDAFFLLYTDGLTDLRNGEGEFFDDEKVGEFILKNPNLGAKEFNDALMKEVNDFKGDMAFPDDISVLSGRIFHHETLEEPKKTKSKKSNKK
ncbi:MAG: PP2C family protein-serine/threonine phosphatase [Aureispira sp.]|nr:PP2C family protein-serine/threonine phosphatase [Aureispira sp.]